LLVTAALIFVISLLTKPPDPGVARFTWYGATPQEKAETRASWNRRDVALSLLVLAAVVAFYVAFW
jgi:SSS family solute:Na+ symporter